MGLLHKWNVLSSDRKPHPASTPKLPNIDESAQAAKEAAKKMEQGLVEQKEAEDCFNSFDSKGSNPSTSTEATKTEHVNHGVLHEYAEAHQG